MFVRDKSATTAYAHSLYRNHATSYFDDVPKLQGEAVGYAILNIDGRVDVDLVRETLAWLRKNSIPSIGDASVIRSFLSLKRLEDWHRQLDGVFFGNWLSSGLPITIAGPDSPPFKSPSRLSTYSSAFSSFASVLWQS